MRNRDDEVPGIVIYKGCSATGYFDINYCPICGRKLV
nr:MAG TPA: Rad50 zinc hook motif [Caudoviricetes sp.]